ncbi:MAG: rhodanese-like domain-containing protein [Proteobacteria bacterium]|nr:rhodanese-like domain-containing protein [Pseudomonadota bacterium]
MRKIFKMLMVSVFISSGLLMGSPAFAESGKPRILKPCKQCHEVDQNQLRGKLKSISKKAETLQVFMGPATWQLTFDKKTELDGAKAFNKIGKNKEILVTYAQDGNSLRAAKIVAKQPASIPPKWIVGVKEMKKLVAKGPKKGNYVLFDARPGKFFLEGHIAGAVSKYDGQFARNVKVLPKNKNKLLVFYCGGPT